jgi:predicted RNase H-related nuclease YkuK (DUF458 family)
MSRQRAPKGHTGQTGGGFTRDVNVARIGRVTIYKRGQTYYLYHREKGKSVRQRVEGNLNTARQLASGVNHALEEGLSFPKISSGATGGQVTGNAKVIGDDR